MQAQQDEPRTTFELAVTLAASGDLIGGCRLGMVTPRRREASIGYAFRRDQWGNGYATEAAGALLRLGFEQLGAHRIFATCDTATRGHTGLWRNSACAARDCTCATGSPRRTPSGGILTTTPSSRMSGGQAADGGRACWGRGSRPLCNEKLATRTRFELVISALTGRRVNPDYTTGPRCDGRTARPC